MEKSARELATAIQQYRQVNHCNVASITVLILDYFLTFDLEVSLIWNSRWNTMKILFLLARYMPFVDASVVLYHQLGFALSHDACKHTHEYAAWMILVGIGIAELILTLRTWAVWGKEKWLTIALPAFFICLWTAAFTIMGFYLKPTTYKTSPLPQLLGCVFENHNTSLAGCYIILMIYDGATLLLMVIRGFSAFRINGNSHLARVVYSDGIIYYIYLFSLSLINVVIINMFPGVFVILLGMMERVIHSVLACRVILHIREQNMHIPTRRAAREGHTTFTDVSSASL